jgi:hypothetical protein
MNPHILNRRSSATLTINERTARLAQAGPQMYRFGFGQSPFPVPTPVIAALQANAAQEDYLPVIRYHVRPGQHAVMACDWDQYLPFAERHLHRARQPWESAGVPGWICSVESS